MLRIEDLRVNFGGIEAVKGITLDVPEKEIVAIIGANGAGKSTTLRAIAGVVKPASGHVFFKDEEMGVLHLPFDTQIPEDVYETLRVNISTAVKGAELMSRIQTLSITDELTGLLNRRGFLQFVKSRLLNFRRENTNSPMVLFMDMDGLKTINDTYGHNEGDIAINAFANILKESLREDDIIGRLGGDEFVVLSAVKSNESGEMIIMRLRADIDKYNNKKLHMYNVSASIGSVILRESTDECFEAAMLTADSVLYEEKSMKKKTRV